MLFQKISTVLKSTEVNDNVEQKGNTPDSLRREVAMSSLILSTAFFDVSQSMATPVKFSLQTEETFDKWNGIRIEWSMIFFSHQLHTNQTANLENYIQYMYSITKLNKTYIMMYKSRSIATQFEFDIYL